MPRPVSAPEVARMLAENVSAERGLALGLINRVVADDQVLVEAERMAEVLHGFGAYHDSKIR